MVLSRINDKINYTEQKSIDKEDKGYNATQYRIEVKDIVITIALGDTKYKYIDDGVLFSPIYLIINNKVNLQIGVYEFNSESLMDVLDEDGDLWDRGNYAGFLGLGGVETTSDDKEKRKEARKSARILNISFGTVLWHMHFKILNLIRLIN